MNLSHYLFERLKEFSHLSCLEVENDVFTYKDLLKISLKVASALKSFGAASEPIGLVGQRKPSSYFGLLGIIFSGCYYVPINPKYTLERKVDILKDSKIRFLVGDKEDLENLLLELPEIVSSDISKWIVPYGDEVLKINWVNSHSNEEIDTLSFPITEKASSLAYVMYTSGSTGKPKGVMVSHNNILAWLENMTTYYHPDQGFRSSQTYDLSFDLSVADIMFTWSKGGILIALSEKEQILPTEYIIRENIEMWSSVPTLASFMFKMGHLKPNSFPSIKTSIFCGEPLNKKIADAWMMAAPNSTVENLYGPTEATIWLTRYVYTQKDKNKVFKNNSLPIGNIFAGHQVELIDEDNQIISKQSEGEIIYKGPQVTLGYFNDEIKTKSNFVYFEWDKNNEIWYKSGDLGFYNEEGLLECLGRKDNQIKIAGRRVELGEIESTLSEIKEIEDVVIVPLKNIENEIIGTVAFCTHIIDKDIKRRIKKESEKSIESIFFPKKFIYIDKFPITTSGKTDRKSLEKIAQESL